LQQGSFRFILTSMLVTDQIRQRISAGGSGGYGPRVLARIRPAKRISAFFDIRQIRRGFQRISAVGGGLSRAHVHACMRSMVCLHSNSLGSSLNRNSQELVQQIFCLSRQRRLQLHTSHELKSKIILIRAMCLFRKGYLL